MGNLQTNATMHPGHDATRPGRVHVASAATTAAKVLLGILVVLLVGLASFVCGFVSGFSYGLKTARLESRGVAAPSAASALVAEAGAAGGLFQRASGDDKEAMSMVAELLTDGRAAWRRLERKQRASQGGNRASSQESGGREGAPQAAADRHLLAGWLPSIQFYVHGGTAEGEEDAGEGDADVDAAAERHPRVFFLPVSCAGLSTDPAGQEELGEEEEEEDVEGVDDADESSRMTSGGGDGGEGGDPDPNSEGMDEMEGATGKRLSRRLLDGSADAATPGGVNAVMAVDAMRTLAQPHVYGVDRIDRTDESVGLRRRQLLFQETEQRHLHSFLHEVTLRWPHWRNEGRGPGGKEGGGLGSGQSYACCTPSGRGAKGQSERTTCVRVRGLPHCGLDCEAQKGTVRVASHHKFG